MEEGKRERQKVSFGDAGTGHFQMETSSVGEGCTSHLMETPSLAGERGERGGGGGGHWKANRRACLP